MVIIVMGVSGVGKTHIGKLVADRLGLPFYDADDFHPTSNVEKMSMGVPLNDNDRLPWLRGLADKILEWSSTGGAVLACSALRAVYRDLLSSKTEEVRFVMLKASSEQIRERMKQREAHYMPPSLLDSQIATLEAIEDKWTVNNAGLPEEVADQVIEKLALS